MPDWTQYIRQNLQLSHLMVEHEAEVIEDLAQQLEDAYTDALHRGLSPSQGEAAAKKHIIDWPALAKQIESSRGGRESAMSALQNRAADRDIAKRGEFSFFTGLMQDIHFGLRMLRKNLGFTAIAVLTLALGIGANTAIFSVVYGVLLQPLPYRDGAGLILLNETTPQVGTVSVSYPNFLDWRKETSQFSQMAAAGDVGFNLAGVNEPEAISGQAVSPNFLSLLGVKPFLGRDFDPSEEKAGASPVLLLSYSLWQSHFGGDPSALGRTIMLDGRGYVIVGVLPPNFRWPDKTDVLEPIGVWAAQNSEDATQRGARGDLVVLGRLAPVATFAQARSEMEGIAARLAKEYPGSNDQFGVELKPIREAFVSEMRPAILALFGAVIFVLLIACANVANLLLVRGSGRTREIALRLALGATRKRIVRQMLMESFLLALAGGGIGLFLAFAGIRGMTDMIGVDRLSGATVEIKGVVLLFAAGIVAMATFVFGLVPAMRSTKTNVLANLKEGSAGAGSGASQNRLRGVFVVAELALSLILLTGAGLMMKSLHLLLSVSPGFQPDRVLRMEMDLRSAQYDKDPAIRNFWERVLDQVGALPGVQSASVGTNPPMTDSHGRTDITVEGMPLPKPGSFPHPDTHVISPGYFATMGIPLLNGRSFTQADNENAQPVGIINAKLAKEFFSNGDAVGKRFMFGRPLATTAPIWIEIVGVVGDTKLYGLTNPARLETYRPFLQASRNEMDLLVKSSIDPAAMTSAIRGAIASIDKDQPIFAISTMNQLVSDSVSTRTFTLILLGLFSGLALVLAAIGTYGVISYSVAQRTRDIGIRIALGASRRDVLHDVLGLGLRLTVAGLIFGLIGAFAVTRVLSSLLYGVHSTDTLTFTSVSLVLIVVAVLASYLPARRAMRIDPIVALRYE
ncbi:MAG: ABC transporter permease [Candidatus Acidiferrum sp.]|jgi:putative ABC transport system permease protein